MDDALERNQASARRMLAVPALTVAVVVAFVGIVVGLAIGIPLVAVAAVLFGVVAFFTNSIAARKRGPELTLAATRSRPVAEAEEPRLHNLVEGLCVGIGLAPPRLRVIDDPAPNALTIARSVDDADLVVTRGLLDRLSLVELEAVLAHELARIRRGEAIVGSVAGLTLGGPGAPFTAAMLATVTRAVVRRGEPVEAWTDLAAVEITRYPPALSSALATMADAERARPSGASPAVAHLWIHGATAEGPFGDALRRVYEPAPPVDQRIEVLEEL